MFLHVFYSWLVAQVLHPLILILSIWIFNGSAGYIPWSSYFFFFLFSAIVSLPCLLLGWLFFCLIVYSGYTFAAKFLLWLASAATLVILNLWIIILVFDNGLDSTDLMIASPGILSIWAASLMRLKQFQKLDHSEQRIPADEKFFQSKNEECHEN